MSWKYGLAGLSVLLILAIGLFSASTSAEEAEFDEATVHLSPACGCCIQHVRYMERAGVEVEVIEHSNAELDRIKDGYEIPQDYRSCHTIEVEGEIVEGHVPIGIMNDVVEERPEVDVVALPGMPQGSPGMPGTKSQEWTFFEIASGEVVGEFAVQ